MTTGRPTPGVLAALAALADAYPYGLTPVQIGGHVEAANVAAGGRGRGQRGPRYVGPATIGAPAIRSLSARGWARPEPRTDGLAGAEWHITPDGFAAAAQHAQEG